MLANNVVFWYNYIVANCIIDQNLSLIDKINKMLEGKKNAVVNIINDKLTLAVFAALEKNLKNVKEINFIIRDTSHLPQERMLEREFAIESELNPKDALFSRYDIVEKSTLKHFAKAKSMHSFISKFVKVKRTTARADVNINLLIIDDEFMISGTSSLEISQKPKRQARFSFNFDSVMTEQMDKSQIVGARKEFERLWHNDFATADFKDELLKSLGYIYKEHSPEFLYYFTLNELFGGQLTDTGIQKFETDNSKFKETKIWKALFNFQKECAWSAIQKLSKYNGCIIADSVGLGKTYEALAVIKYYELRNDNVLVLSPARLYDNWMSFKGAYKDSSLGETFNYKIMFHTDLSRTRGDSRSGYDLSRFDWSKFDLVVIDESHNFRNRTQKDDSMTRYMRLLEEVIKNQQKTKVLLLSATPVNNSLVDLKNQISLITGDRDDAFADEGIDSVSKLLSQTSSAINYWDAQAQKDKSLLYDRLPAQFYKLLEMLTISRSRKHIVNAYGDDGIGTFPTKLTPDTFTPEIDSHGELLKITPTNELLEALKLSVYTPMSYIKSEHKSYYRNKYKTTYRGRDIFFQDERELITKNLHRFNLFKRLESSVHSFGQTIDRLIGRINAYVEVLGSGGDFASDNDTNEDIDEDTALDYKLDIKISHLRKADFLDDLQYDLELLERLKADVDTILDNGRDKKIAELREIIKAKITTTPYNKGNKKVLIFTAFADTAEYLFFQFNELFDELDVAGAVVTGSRAPRIHGNFLHQEFNNILKSFSPKSKGVTIDKPKNEITVLIGTDCISEGQNLQDCDTVINYDIHWNPVSLIQRFGRIDRIGSQNSQIKMINFFPAIELNEYLSLEKRIKGKMLSVNLASTGDENLLNPELNDINFRRRQLERLRKEVIDLEDASDNLSLTDLNQNEYLYELSQFIKREPHLLKTPRGIFSAVQNKVRGNGGVIFCFRHEGYDHKPKNDSSLYPYYMVYIGKDEKIVIGCDSARQLLKEFRSLAINQKEVDTLAQFGFKKETNDATDMKVYSDLLNIAIQSIQGSEDKKAESSALGFGGFKNEFAESSTDDFELISMLVVRDGF